MIHYCLKCLISDQQSNSELKRHVECFKNFIDKNKNLFDLEKIDQTRSVPLDVTNLINDSEFVSSWPTFNTELFECPDTTLRLLEYCLHEVSFGYFNCWARTRYQAFSRRKSYVSYCLI